MTVIVSPSDSRQIGGSVVLSLSGQQSDYHEY